MALFFLSQPSLPSPNHSHPKQITDNSLELSMPLLKPGRMGGDLDEGPKASQGVRQVGKNHSVVKISTMEPGVGVPAHALSLVTPGSKASVLQPAALALFSTKSPAVRSYSLVPSTV